MDEFVEILMITVQIFIAFIIFVSVIHFLLHH